MTLQSVKTAGAAASARSPIPPAWAKALGDIPPADACKATPLALRDVIAGIAEVESAFGTRGAGALSPPETEPAITRALSSVPNTWTSPYGAAGPMQIPIGGPGGDVFGAYVAGPQPPPPPPPPPPATTTTTGSSSTTASVSPTTTTTSAPPPPPPNPWYLPDAIDTVAHYLCAHGAGSGNARTGTGAHLVSAIASYLDAANDTGAGDPHLSAHLRSVELYALGYMIDQAAVVSAGTPPVGFANLAAEVAVTPGVCAPKGPALALADVLDAIGFVESTWGTSTLPGVQLPPGLSASKALAAARRLPRRPAKTPAGYWHIAGTNAYGAAGPMQIGIGGPSGDTWGEYGRLGPGESGTPNPWNASDALASAAADLCANGAGSNLAGAIYAYNHSKTYVTEVLTLAGTYAQGAP